VPALITAAASVLVAVLAGLLTYRNSRVLGMRQDRLARLNAQLEELYGPLFALAQASAAAFAALRERHEHGRVYGSGTELTDEQRQVWTQWMTTVFMPMNRRSYEIIVTKAHLLDGDEMPQCLLDFCAHVAGYEAIVGRWDNGDYSTVGSLLNHPGDPYVEHLRETFGRLKRRQQQVLRSVRAV
jgi:hypothetical protein